MVELIEFIVRKQIEERDDFCVAMADRDFKNAIALTPREIQIYLTADQPHLLPNNLNIEIYGNRLDGEDVFMKKEFRLDFHENIAVYKSDGTLKEIEDIYQLVYSNVHSNYFDISMADVLIKTIKDNQKEK